MNKNLEFTGKIIKKETKSGTSKAGKEWSKLEFVVMDSAEYPQSAKFELFNKPDDADFVKVDNVVKVKFNLKGNEYNGNFYTNLSAWSVRLVEGGESKKEPVTDLPPPSEVDELPF